MIKELYALISLSRPLNLFFVALAQVLCSIYIMGLTDYPRLLLLSSGTLMITAAGYVINDYFDVKADAINKPKNVLIGRAVSRRKALLFVLILNTSSLVIAVFIGKTIAVTYLAIIVLLWLYSYLLKRSFLIGNLLVASLAGFSIYILSYFKPISSPLIAFVFFAFITNLIREIIKDAEDVKGDLLLGSNTLPIKLGIQNTRIVILLLMVIFLMSMWYATVMYQNSTLYLPAGLISAITVWCVVVLFKENMNKGFSAASNFLKVIMLIGCLSIPLL